MYVQMHIQVQVHTCIAERRYPHSQSSCPNPKGLCCVYHFQINIKTAVASCITRYCDCSVRIVVSHRASCACGGDVVATFANTCNLRSCDHEVRCFTISRISQSDHCANSRFPCNLKARFPHRFTSLDIWTEALTSTNGFSMEGSLPRSGKV
jgi:hypothetical protein